MLKVPYGINDFIKIRTEGYYYIDKTQYIEELEDRNGLLYYQFLRPFKFGKTLFIDILEKYYDVLYKDKFDELFGNLYIGKHPTKERNSYYVLRLDFSKIKLTEDNIDEARKLFRECVREDINNFAKKHNLDFFIDEKKEFATSMLFSLASYIEHNTDYRLYVIVDDYDFYMRQTVLYNLRPEYEVEFRNYGFVRAFFEELKKVTNPSVHRIFITGMLAPTLDSLVTGFDIAWHATFTEQFHNMMGFTPEEVDELLRQIKEDYKLKDRQIEEIREFLKNNYEGYFFHEFLDSQLSNLYNPNMVLYVLDTYLREGKLPQHLLDNETISYFRCFKNILKLNKEKGKNILQIFKDDKVDEKLGVLLFRYLIEFNVGITHDDIVSILYYAGFITFNNFNPYVVRKIFGFRYPNYAVKQQIKKELDKISLDDI